jgi:hypothetical protein
MIYCLSVLQIYFSFVERFKVVHSTVITTDIVLEENVYALKDSAVRIALRTVHTIILTTTASKNVLNLPLRLRD